MKKQLLIPLCLALLLGACTTSSSPQNDEDLYAEGPIVSQDTRTDEEKELEMIQECISDYNTEGRIAELEKKLLTTLTPLPLEITSMPEISSLEDLTSEEIDPALDNSIYIGSYMVEDKYKAVFHILNPNGGLFWLNGTITFHVEPENVKVDAPEFEELRENFAYLLKHEDEILSWLYGLNVTCAEEEGPIEGYHQVLAMGDHHPETIEDIKTIAESVFTQEYLQSNFYYSAFESESSTFKQIDGLLYCAESELSSSSMDPRSYDPDYIIAAQTNGDTVDIDLLQTINGNLQNVVCRVQMVNTSAGYRLPASY